MNLFKSLSVGAKLVLSFVAVAACTVIVGGVGVYSLATINGLLKTMYERQLTGCVATVDLQRCVAAIGRDVRELCLVDDEASRTRLTKSIEDSHTGVLENLKLLEQLSTTPETRTQYQKLADLYPKFWSMMTEARDFGTSNQTDKAMATIRTALPTAIEIRGLTKDIADARKGDAMVASNNGSALYSTARTFLFSTIAAAACFGLGLGVWISRWFTKAIVEVDQISNNVAAASQELAAASEQLSSGAQQSASSLEETASSLEEMTATVRQNADNADQANQLANSARSTAERGGEVVANAVKAMSEINQSSKKIADIITTIDEIAFQTNLLALNAAVEAARAGEQGRGFAVVAGEVRSLAQRSATAAREIKTLIGDSVQKVETGSELVNRSGATLEEIVTSVKRVTDIVAEIAAASREQSAGIDQINKAVSQMDQVTQSNASQTEELSGTATALSGQAEQLQTVVSQFNLKEQAAPSASTKNLPRPATKAFPSATGKPARKSKPAKQPAPVARELEAVGVGAAGFDGFEEF